MKIAVLGASRGLGAALVHFIRSEKSDSIFFLASRNGEGLIQQARPVDQVHIADFTRAPDQELLVTKLEEFMPEKIFYVAGGGPYGAYHKKTWIDHEWAYELNLLFPSRLLHMILTAISETRWAGLTNITLVGSAIAGRQADPNAAAYAASKHGMRGLVESLAKENHKINIKLYEPGYMDTKMLPPNAWPRQQGIVKSVEEEARNLWQYSNSAVD